MSTEPGPEEKVEFAIAQLSSLFYNINKGKGKKPKSAVEFMLFRHCWEYKPNSGDDDVDNDIALIMAAFSTRLTIARN